MRVLKGRIRAFARRQIALCMAESYARQKSIGVAEAYGILERCGWFADKLSPPTIRYHVEYSIGLSRDANPRTLGVIRMGGA